jgi:hypothetical protein
MLRSGLSVLAGQRRFVRRNPHYADAHRAGVEWLLRFWRDGLVERVRAHMREGRRGAALADGALLLRHYPRDCTTHALRKLRVTLRARRSTA